MKPTGLTAASPSSGALVSDGIGLHRFRDRDETCGRIFVKDLPWCRGNYLLMRRAFTCHALPLVCPAAAMKDSGDLDVIIDGRQAIDGQ